jgi:hypothetical protein
VHARMGKSRSNHDDLAGCFLRAAGVAAIWIDEGGHIGAADVATIDDQPGRIIPPRRPLPPELSPVRMEAGCPGLARGDRTQARGDGGWARRRAHEASNCCRSSTRRGCRRQACVRENALIGELREWNAAFKEARAVEPTLRYTDFTAAKKAGMLEELARRTNG